MIWFEPNNGKVILLISAAIAVTIFTFSLWLKNDPFSQAANNQNHFWTQVFDRVSQTFAGIKTSVELGIKDSKNIAQEASNQALKAELLEKTQEYLEEKKASTTQETAGQLTADNQEDCQRLGGHWGRFGAEAIELCNFDTTDAGKICTDSSQCQAYCLADIDELSQTEPYGGQAVATSGYCASQTLLTGCNVIVLEGWARGIVCE